MSQSSVTGLRQGHSLVVAIDGPSGSGKSSVAREVARRLGLAYQDTGAMYRALTWFCVAAGITLDDAGAVESAAEDFEFSQSTSPDESWVRVGPGARLGSAEASVEVTAQIRDPQISESVSAVATNLGARTELVRRQRAAVEAVRGRMVVEGRDITTVVAPRAEVRLLLTASEEARLARRGAQLTSAGESQSSERLAQQVLARDARDATVAQFLRAADGVVTIDSSDLDFEQTVAAVIRLVVTTVEGGSRGQQE
ncbi:(d)CMP kinase [Psychromicrobium xiongbiense]|uniref:(d)CMP kinase n=1 Tax=Psychromicrobium xiongbiense TaxID=3051184 RepID=UPI002554D6F1|nr:(d)CMP kinase [Psychromicrobium sp. YIM S02556]